MLKDITQAMETIKATINELHQDDMKVIAAEMKSMIDKALNKPSNNMAVKTAAELKGENINIIVSELKSIVQETISNLDRETAGESTDCGPVIICFVLKDVERVNIYNGACGTWEPDDGAKSCAVVV